MRLVEGLGFERGKLRVPVYGGYDRCWAVDVEFGRRQNLRLGCIYEYADVA